VAPFSDTAEARKAFEEVSSSLKGLERDLDTAQGSISRLTGGFGPDAEWKKLEGTCIEKEQGE
jgi:protein kinase C substrate 80K-H